MTKYMTVSQVAKEYGFPVRTIYDGINSFELPAYKLAGKTKYLKRSEVDMWVESKKVCPLLRYKNVIKA